MPPSLFKVQPYMRVVCPQGMPQCSSKVKLKCNIFFYKYPTMKKKRQC